MQNVNNVSDQTEYAQRISLPNVRGDLFANNQCSKDQGKQKITEQWNNKKKKHNQT